MPILTPTEIRVPWAAWEPVEGVSDEAVVEEVVDRLDRLDRGHAHGGRAVVALGCEPPRWLGDDLWARLEAPARYRAWVESVAARIGDRCRHWVTVDAPNTVAVRGWILGTAPPGRRLAVGDFVRATDHLLAAHVAAHNVLHGHRADAVSTVRVAPAPSYERGPLLVDILLSRSACAARHDVHEWLVGRRAAWDSGRRRPGPMAVALRRTTRSAIPLEQAFPRTLDAVWNGPNERPVDDGEREIRAGREAWPS
jgi:hypothetical protein